MKKITLLFVLFFSFYSFQKSVAQCPGCLIDNTLTTPGIYPNNLPNGTQGQAYSTDVTFVMFTDTSGYTVNYFKILSVSGLPFGLTWECNNSGNNCQYDPAVNIRGCVKICGTPMQTGSFTMNVYVLTNLQTVGNFNSIQPMTITIDPSTGGNSGFSYSPNQACDSTTAEFNALIDGSPNPTSYNWHFGNGDSSNVKNPPAQNYNTPGDYVISLETSILGYKVTGVNIASVQPGWGGDVEEPSETFFNPDPYFEIFNSASTNLFTSPFVQDSLSATWSGLDINLTEPPYNINVWDIDDVSVNDNLGNFAFNVTGAGTIPFTGSGGTSGSIVVETFVIQSFIHYDTLHIYASPLSSTISTVGNDSVCLGDSVQLYADNTGTNTIQWYNDTAVIVGANTPYYTTNQSGNFWVELTNQSGCTFASSPQNVFIVPPPPFPSFLANVNMLTCLLTGYTLQWTLNGVPIPGANYQTYEISQNGVYSVIAKNSFGCIRSSSPNYLQYTSPAGIEEMELLNAVTIFPNPATDELNFSVNEKMMGYRYHLTDCIGRTLQQGLINETLIKLTLSDYEKGMYFLSIEGKTKKTFKVLKN